MRLSEAILLGSTVTRQCKGWGDGVTESCALGAAAKALGHPLKEGILKYFGLFVEFPWLQKDQISCPTPKCNFPCHDGEPWQMIAHLNNTHKWTREQIAEWVAKIEPAETTEPIVETVPEAVCA